MTTITKSYQLSVKTKENYYVSKTFLMKKKVNILSSGKIRNQLDKNSYLNIDIPTSTLILNEKDKSATNDYIITFNNYDCLSNIKNYMQHPYEISSVRISDISYYLQKLKVNLLILDSECDYDAIKNRNNFNALTIENKAINNSYIPVSAIEFKFDS